MNAMGSDYIREVNVVKSARVGYSKMLLGVYAYFIEHKQRNTLIFDLTEAQQLTAEEQVEKWVDGRKKILWDSKKRRNEALDCFVYALAALRISISRWQLDLSALLASLQEEDGAATNKKTLADYARALSGEDE